MLQAVNLEYETVRVPRSPAVRKEFHGADLGAGFLPEHPRRRRMIDEPGRQIGVSLDDLPRPRGVDRRAFHDLGGSLGERAGELDGVAVGERAEDAECQQNPGRRRHVNLRGRRDFTLVTVGRASYSIAHLGRRK
jgi:hypothetical protein